MVPNLLVTDDDTALRRSLCEALSRSGFRVHEAGDGDEALRLLEVTPVHFALVDVHMPRVTGLEVLQRLADLPHRPTCALMSAELDDKIVAEARRWAAYRILSKPIRLHAIRQLVHGALEEVYGWKSA